MAGISDWTVSFRRWQKLIARRILKTVFPPVSAGAAARIAVKFVSLAIFYLSGCSANHHRLWSTLGGRSRKIGRATYLLIGRGFCPVPRPSSVWNAAWVASPVVAKDEFVEIDLELIAAHAVISSISHCCRLPIARSAKGTTDFAPLRRSIRSG